MWVLGTGLSSLQEQPVISETEPVSSRLSLPSQSSLLLGMRKRHASFTSLKALAGLCKALWKGAGTLSNLFTYRQSTERVDFNTSSKRPLMKPEHSHLPQEALDQSGDENAIQTSPDSGSTPAVAPEGSGMPLTFSPHSENSNIPNL